jgi:hypothetical protein
MLNIIPRGRWTPCNRPRYVVQSFSQDKHNFANTVLTPIQQQHFAPTAPTVDKSLTNVVCDKSQVLTAVPINTTLFRDATKCMLVHICATFRNNVFKQFFYPERRALPSAETSVCFSLHSVTSFKTLVMY